MGISIRFLEVADADAVMALSSRLAVGVAPWRPPDGVASAVAAWVRQAIDDFDGDHHPLWIAESDGQVVGLIAGHASRHWTGDVDAYVGELAVAADRGRQGVGSALIARFEDWARERGHTRVRLETGAANAGAISFYTSRGYDLEEVVLSKPL